MADLAPGILSIYFGEAVLLTILASSLLLLIYRRAVASTMRAAVGPSATEALAAAPIRRVAGTASRRSPAQMERRAQLRLAVVYILAGGLAAAVLAGLFLISLGDETRGLQTFVVWYVYAWPVPLLLPTLLALPRRAALVAFGSYTLWGAVVVAAWSIGSLALGQARNPPWQNVLSYLTFLGMQAWPPFLIILATGSRRQRSVAPMVLAGLLLFSFGNLLLTNLLTFLLDFAPLRDALRLVGAYPLWAFWFMLGALPVGYLCWSAMQWLSRAFERRTFSDVQLLVDCWWLIAVFFVTTMLATDLGWSGLAGLSAFVVYRAMVALGLLLWPVGREMPSDRRLLLLRVFGFQRRTERLFDVIAQRWRLIGSVKLIGARDLAMRTIDPSDVVAFVGGRLRRQFVRDGADLEQRLSRLEETPDPDGRFRIEKFFCHGHTWRPTLQALLGRSDLVLMDLRSFSATNSGCLFELGQLVACGLLGRTLFVVDETTDVALVQATLRDQARQLGVAAVPPNIEQVNRASGAELDRLRRRLLALAA